MEALPIGIEPIKIKEIDGGYGWQYTFDNGYGASVILTEHSYGHEDGLYELLLTKALVKGEPAWRTPDVAFIESITESEPGGDDTGLYGWLTLEDVARILGVIRGYQTPVQRAITRYTVSDGEWKGSANDSW
jgi:hypothetical protein